MRLKTPQVEKSLICNETIEGYLAAIKHLEILFGNSQNDSICGKMVAKSSPKIGSVNKAFFVLILTMA
jgi:hypothetical protein